MIRKVVHQDINVAEFISVCVFLSEECGKIIRRVEESGDLKTISKGADNPVTIADITVQKTLEVNLKHIYPTLQVQGEESAESIANVDSAVDPSSITAQVRNFITTDMLNQKHDQRREWISNVLREYYTEDEVSSDHFSTFNTEDAVVWIDPLDGTNDFVKGNLSAVTVLIGLSIKDKSRIGIVHNPFSEQDREVGKTIFGTAEHGVYKVVSDKNMSVDELVSRELEYFEPFDNTEPEEGHQIRVAASLTHFSAQMKEILETLDPVEIVRMGGAGNKCCNLAQGNVDAYIHPSPGLMYWDLCGPESLVKGMGGWATNLLQERLTYPVNAPNHKLKGLVLAKNPPMYATIKSRMGALLTNIAKTVKL